MKAKVKRSVVNSCTLFPRVMLQSAEQTSCLKKFKIAHEAACRRAPKRSPSAGHRGSVTIMEMATKRSAAAETPTRREARCTMTRARSEKRIDKRDVAMLAERSPSWGCSCCALSPCRHATGEMREERWSMEMEIDDQQHQHEKRKGYTYVSLTLCG